MSSAVRAVLCDLDDTLFDHTHASRCAASALHHAMPDFACWSVEEFMRRHSETLEVIHLDVLAGRVSIAEARIERFRRLLVAAQAARADAIAPDLARDYRRAYEAAWQTVAGAVPLLAALKQRGLLTAVVTNNLVSEQRIKLEQCGLAMHVDALLASEEVGVQKPDPRIFQAALDRLNVEADAAVMIGDAWSTDIEGARAAGIRPVWLNRFGAVALDPTVRQIRSLEPTEMVLAEILESA